MRIVHIFDKLNAFGGAEEHMTTLARLQKSKGNDVSVCLIQSSTRQNQYAKRLVTASVTICQWPVWLNRLSGDWNTIEALLQHSIRLLSPLTVTSAFLIASVSRRPRQETRESLEGRLRSIVRRLLNPQRQKQLFRVLLTWRYYWHRPDVLHLHTYGAGLEFVLHWARGRNLATIHQEHSTPDTTARRWYNLPTADNLASIVVTVSKSSAQALRELCGVKRPLEVIAPIVTTNITRREKTQQSRPGKYGHSILTIARLSEEKGLSYLIEAAERVASEDPKVCFLIYGEGPLRESLAAQIKAAQLSDNVRLAGRFTRNQLPTIMRSADIFVLPSITEGFPVTLIEAMMYGMPIVATRVGGVPELVSDSVTALLCPPADPIELARAILTLSREPSKCRELGRAAQDAYRRSDFTPERVVSRFTKVYTKAIQMHQSGAA
jgi:glycosyltransferase involved in cell wall biosynthesis